jgi:phosphatidylinositol glycan class O
MDMFGQYFDFETHYPSYNIRDLDTNDASVHLDILEIFEKHPNFDLLVCHFLGIDHAGHTFNSNHSEIERKIIETERKIKEII